MSNLFTYGSAELRARDDEDLLRHIYADGIHTFPPIIKTLVERFERLLAARDEREIEEKILDATRAELEKVTESIGVKINEVMDHLVEATDISSDIAIDLELGKPDIPAALSHIGDLDIELLQAQEILDAIELPS